MLLALILIAVLILCCCRRKKKTLDSPNEANEPVHSVKLDSGPEYQHVSGFKSISAAQTEDSEQQEELM
ncbi:hypothetical protein OYC64_016297 [Pagothenia borchgrevinki]|uniref:Uncharacterized protein n=1 Tax=Pagothenia borchgrevinki TaxID=8213 RepID=A0ABD2HKA5_PAGBO